jgi:chemotaxis protein CheD
MGGGGEETRGEVEALAAAAAEAMGHATKALTALLDLPVRSGSPRAQCLPVASAAQALREAPTVETALSFSVTGDPEGALLFFFPPGGVRALTSRLTGQPQPEGGLAGALGESALKEAGNILASAYLSAASRWAGRVLRPSVPRLTTDWSRAGADDALDGLLPDAGMVLLVEVPFGAGRRVKGRLLWFPGTQTRSGLLRWGQGAGPEVIRVPAATSAAGREPDRLWIAGMGSCVGVALYDPGARVGGLAHVLVPTGGKGADERGPAASPERAVAALLQAVAASGGEPGRCVAKLAGGGQAFEGVLGRGRSQPVGPQTAAAVRAELGRRGILVVAEAISPEPGRSMELDLASGTVKVRWPDGKVQVL